MFPTLLFLKPFEEPPNEPDEIHYHNDWPGPDSQHWRFCQGGVETGGSEFGGLNYVLQDHIWDPKAPLMRGNRPECNAHSADEFLESYSALIDLAAKLKKEEGLCAAVYTELSDIEAEPNGFATYDRLLKVDAAVEAFQRQKVATVKAERNAAAVKAALEALRRAAVDGGNVVPPIFEAVKTYASLGEICDVLRGVYGEYSPGG